MDQGKTNGVEKKANSVGSFVPSTNVNLEASPSPPIPTSSRPKWFKIELKPRNDKVNLSRILVRETWRALQRNQMLVDC